VGSSPYNMYEQSATTACSTLDLKDISKYGTFRCVGSGQLASGVCKANICIGMKCACLFFVVG